MGLTLLAYINKEGNKERKKNKPEKAQESDETLNIVQ